MTLVAALTACPSCGSRLLQPMRQHPRKGEEVLVDLRCPECHVLTQSACSPADVQELDRLQSVWREEIVHAYERSVAESMEALAACFGPALALDLVGADDFAPPRKLRRAA